MTDSSSTASPRAKQLASGKSIPMVAGCATLSDRNARDHTIEISKYLSIMYVISADRMAETLGSAVLRLGTDDTGLKQGLDRAERTSEQRMRDIGRKMSIAVTGPILAIGAAVFKSSEEIGEALGMIQAGTGATGEALEALEDDFNAVFGTVDADAATVAGVIADLNTHLGLTGEGLQHATRVAVEFADSLGHDTQQSVVDTVRAMSIFGVEGDQFATTMDKMLVVSQQTGIGVGELTGQLQTYGPVLANAGYSMDEAIALLANFSQSGIDASRVFPGLNAFLRRSAEEVDEYGDSLSDSRDEISDSSGKLLELSGSVSAATKEIGNLEEAEKSAANKSFDLRSALEEQIASVAAAETETEALAIATDAFGAEGAQRLSVAIRSGAFGIEDLTGMMDNAEGSVVELDEATETLGEKTRQLGNEAKETAGGKFGGAAGTVTGCYRGARRCARGSWAAPDRTARAH